MDDFYNNGSTNNTASSRGNQRWGESNNYEANKYEEDRKRRDLNSFLAIPPPLPLLPQRQ